MSDIEARIVDLVKFSSGQKPIEFGDAFRSILQDRVSSAIEAKKQEIAAAMFAPPSEEEEDAELSDNRELEDVEVEDQEDGQAT